MAQIGGRKTRGFCQGLSLERGPRAQQVCDVCHRSGGAFNVSLLPSGTREQEGAPGRTREGYLHGYSRRSRTLSLAVIYKTDIPRQPLTLHVGTSRAIKIRGKKRAALSCSPEPLRADGGKPMRAPWLLQV